MEESVKTIDQILETLKYPTFSGTDETEQTEEQAINEQQLLPGTNSER